MGGSRIHCIRASIVWHADLFRHEQVRSVSVLELGVPMFEHGAALGGFAVRHWTLRLASLCVLGSEQFRLILKEERLNL